MASATRAHGEAASPRSELGEGEKKKRLQWTDAMRVDFICTILEIGLGNATPESVQELMPAGGGMSADLVQAHLTKCRVDMQAAKDELGRNYQRLFQTSPGDAVGGDGGASGGGGGDRGLKRPRREGLAVAAKRLACGHLAPASAIQAPASQTRPVPAPPSPLAISFPRELGALADEERPAGTGIKSGAGQGESVRQWQLQQPRQPLQSQTQASLRGQELAMREHERLMSEAMHLHTLFERAFAGHVHRFKEIHASVEAAADAADAAAAAAAAVEAAEAEAGAPVGSENAAAAADGERHLASPSATSAGLDSSDPAAGGLGDGGCWTEAVAAPTGAPRAAAAAAAAAAPQLDSGSSRWQVHGAQGAVAGQPLSWWRGGPAAGPPHWPSPPLPLPQPDDSSAMALSAPRRVGGRGVGAAFGAEGDGIAAIEAVAGTGPSLDSSNANVGLGIGMRAPGHATRPSFSVDSLGDDTPMFEWLMNGGADTEDDFEVSPGALAMAAGAQEDEARALQLSCFSLPLGEGSRGGEEKREREAGADDDNFTATAAEDGALAQLQELEAAEAAEAAAAADAAERAATAPAAATATAASPLKSSAAAIAAVPAWESSDRLGGTSSQFAAVSMPTRHPLRPLRQHLQLQEKEQQEQLESLVPLPLLPMPRLAVPPPLPSPPSPPPQPLRAALAKAEAGGRSSDIASADDSTGAKRSLPPLVEQLHLGVGGDRGGDRGGDGGGGDRETANAEAAAAAAAAAATGDTASIARAGAALDAVAFDTLPQPPTLPTGKVAAGAANSGEIADPLGHGGPLESEEEAEGVGEALADAVGEEEGEGDSAEFFDRLFAFML